MNDCIYQRSIDDQDNDTPGSFNVYLILISRFLLIALAHRVLDAACKLSSAFAFPQSYSLG